MAVQQAAIAAPTAGELVHGLGVEWDTTNRGCTVCRPYGDLDAFTVPRFRQLISEAASSPHVIFDLSRVPFLDSAGLGALVGGVRRVRDLGGDVAICTSRAVHARLLHTTGFDQIVDISPDVPGASAALHRGDDPAW